MEIFARCLLAFFMIMISIFSLIGWGWAIVTLAICVIAGNILNLIIFGVTKDLR